MQRKLDTCGGLVLLLCKFFLSTFCRSLNLCLLGLSHSLSLHFYTSCSREQSPRTVRHACSYQDAISSSPSSLFSFRSGYLCRCEQLSFHTMEVLVQPRPKSSAAQDLGFLYRLVEGWILPSPQAACGVECMNADKRRCIDFCLP